MTDLAGRNTERCHWSVAQLTDGCWRVLATPMIEAAVQAGRA